MAARLLNHHEALSAGADLWILPTTTYSAWTKRLDWPLNLQISKAANYIGRKPPPDLITILQQNDLQYDVSEPKKRNLIVSTQGLLPANRIVLVPGETWETWSKAAVQAWQDLGKPATRFFIPTFANWDKVKGSWPSVANSDDIQIVTSES